MNVNRQDLDEILAESPESVVYTVGLDEKIKTVTPTVEKLFGYTPQELIGANIRKILTAESYEKQRVGMLKALKENRSTGEVLILDVVKKNGESIPAEIFARFEKDASGNPTGILGIAKAVTM